MDLKEPTLTEEVSSVQTHSPGKMLSSTRLSWDLSIEEVAENLNLSVDTVEALERDDYERLPGYTFVKGYIRSYANLLRLDPDEVLDGVELEPEKLNDIPAPRTTVKTKVRSRPKKKKSGGKFLKSLVLIFLVIVLALVGLNQFSKLDKDEVAKILKLPTAEETQDSGEIAFPKTESESSENGKKEALIRIE